MIDEINPTYRLPDRLADTAWRTATAAWLHVGGDYWTWHYGLSWQFTIEYMVTGRIWQSAKAAHEPGGDFYCTGRLYDAKAMVHPALTEPIQYVRIYTDPTAADWDCLTVGFLADEFTKPSPHPDLDPQTTLFDDYPIPKIGWHFAGNFHRADVARDVHQEGPAWLFPVHVGDYGTEPDVLDAFGLNVSHENGDPDAH